MYRSTFRLVEFGWATKTRTVTANDRDTWERKFRLVDYLFSYMLNRAVDPNAYVSITTDKP